MNVTSKDLAFRCQILTVDRHAYKIYVAAASASGLATVYSWVDAIFWVDLLFSM